MAVAPTPHLVFEPDVLEANLDAMAALCHARGVALRPHFKAHRCLRIARAQLDRGAIGITAATLGEVEILAASGVRTILLANEIADAAKTSRLAAVAARCDLMIAVANDTHLDIARRAARDAPLGVLVEVDVGMPRAGIQPEAVLDFARAVAQSPGLELRGLMGYEGHVMLQPDETVRRAGVEAASAILSRARTALENAGLPCGIVSGGGTGTAAFWDRDRALTEIQAGSYVAMDSAYTALAGVGFEQAVFLETTVLAAPRAGLRTLDAGLKSMSTDHGPPALADVAGDVLHVADEHTLISLAEPDGPPHVGDRVRLVPSHIDPTINLHDRARAGTDWWRIEARGRSA